MNGIVEAVRTALGEAGIAVDDGFGPVTIDVAPEGWVAALRAASGAGATYLDFLTAYDLEVEGFAVVAHVATPDVGDHVLLRTRVPREEPRLASATEVFRGAAWHERETGEMFGIEFCDHLGSGGTQVEPLLLSPSAPTAPMRKEVVLLERPTRPWPGAKDPTDSGGKSRRRMLPPGVPADWPATIEGDRA